MNYNNFINDFSYTAELRTLSTLFCCIGFVAAWLAVVGDIVAWLSAAWKCLRGRASFNRYYEPGATGNRRYYEPDSRSTGTGSGRTI